MINDSAKSHSTIQSGNQGPGLEIKDSFGYDNRLSMNEAQFLAWSETKEGRTALATGVLDPQAEKTKTICCHIPYPNQVVPEAPEVPDMLSSTCLKEGKKSKYKLWRGIHNTDFVYSQKRLNEELAKLTMEEIIDDAEIREATQGYHAGNTLLKGCASLQ